MSSDIQWQIELHYDKLKQPRESVLWNNNSWRFSVLIISWLTEGYDKKMAMTFSLEKTALWYNIVAPLWKWCYELQLCWFSWILDHSLKNYLILNFPSSGTTTAATKYSSYQVIRDIGTRATFHLARIRTVPPYN